MYQGAPAPVSAFLTVGPKAAAFAVLLRIFMTAFEPIASRWEPRLGLRACDHDGRQLRRAQQIEHQAHAGLQLHRARRICAGCGGSAFRDRHRRPPCSTWRRTRSRTSERSRWSTYFSGKGERYVGIDDFAGLAQRQPGMAAMLTIFLLSLIGVPLTGGFFGKFYIFKAALDANLVWLTVLGLLNSAVAAYYYLRILVVMYMHEPGEAAKDLAPAGAAVKVAVYASALGTLALGIFPGWLLDFATKSALK